MVISMFTTNSFAQQLEEVRGVQTRVVKYEASNGENAEYKKDYLSGFEFKNENNYTVWVEAELETLGFNASKREWKGGTYDKKSFTLKPGEIYIWKCGRKMMDWDYGYYVDCSDKFYVNYKAYKAK